MQHYIHSFHETTEYVEKREGTVKEEQLLADGYNLVDEDKEGLLQAGEEAKGSQRIERDRSIRKKKSAPESPSTLICQLCLNKFNSMVEHSNHILSHYEQHPDLVPYHVAQKPFVCAVCQEGPVFGFRSELVVHHRGHLNMAPYVCPENGCNNVFRSKDTLRQHSYTHAEKKFICEVCGAAFRRRNELGQHRVRHQDEGIAYQCTQCKVVCKNRISYKAHLKHHLQGKRFKCERNGCPKAFFSKSDLEVHERSHTNDKRYKCPLCICAYTSQSQLNRHLKQHERRKVTKCDKCTLSFSDYTEFCNHRITTHGEWLPHRCKHCKQGYQNVRALERHIGRCKYRQGHNASDNTLSYSATKDRMDMEDMDMSVKSDGGLSLEDNSLQNNAEFSNRYVHVSNIVDSHDGSNPNPKAHSGQHYMIVPDDNWMLAEQEDGGQYMVIKKDAENKNFTYEVLL